MDANLDALARELSALTERFADLGARLGSAARSLEDGGAPPPDGLVDDLEGARAQFIQLRTDVLTAAQAASIPPKGQPESLTDLEPLLGAIATAIRRQAAQAVEPAGVAAAVGPPVLAAPPAEPPRIELEIAAPPPVPEPATLAVDQPVRMPTIEMPSLTLEPSEPVAAAAPPKLVAPAKPAAASKAATPSRPTAPSKPAAPSKAPAPAAPAAEPSAPDETAQWWLAAWARWSGWKATHDFAGVVRDEVGKYPYLLSVPIQKSPEYEEGLLAYGYSILIDHVEKQNPGCVGNALNSLKAGVARPVGEQLYDYLVTEGRLREIYPEFVKNALVAAVPEPGLWFQFRILESKEDTRIFQRPSARLGDSEIAGQRLASDAQRYAEHKFKMTLPALTLRCVLVSADSIRETRGIGVKLVADGAASDSAWIATVAAGGRGKTDARQVGQEGTHVPGLGKDYGSVWIAVYNADPAADRRYELSVFLRKDSKSPFRRSS